MTTTLKQANNKKGKTMKLKSALASSGLNIDGKDTDLMFVEGAIAADPDSNQIRIYSDPRNLGHYVLVDQKDVEGNLETMHSDYLGQFGLSGYAMYRIPLRWGTRLKVVDIKTHQLGLSIAPFTAMDSVKADAGDCSSSTYCSSGCCEFAENGKCYCNHCCYG